MKWLKEHSRKISFAVLSLLIALTVVVSGVNVTVSPADGLKLLTIGNNQVTLTIGTASATGATDYTVNGLNDSATFQTAIDALPATGGKLEVLGGSYIFTATVTRAINNITIEGVGQGTSFTFDGVNPIFTAGGNNWVLSNFDTDAGDVSFGATTGWVRDNVNGNSLSSPSVTVRSLTSGRVPVAGVGGLLGDDADLSFSGDTLTLAKLSLTNLASNLIPDGVDTRNIGSATAEVANVYVGDVGRVYLGLGQDVSLYRSALNTLGINGFSIEHNATVLNFNVLTAGDEFRVTQTRAYTQSQQPLWQINQLSTGESAFRILHSDDGVNGSWLFGQLGRSPGGAGALPANTIHRDMYFWLDSQKVAFRLIAATDITAARMVVGSGYWVAATPPNARFSVDGAYDEIQGIVRGFSTQTGSIFEVQKSDNTPVMQIPNAARSTWAYGMDFPNNADIRFKNAAGVYNSFAYVSAGDVLTLDGDGLMMSILGPVKASALKSGTDQATAGAAANELWVDTSDNGTIKRGV